MWPFKNIFFLNKTKQNFSFPLCLLSARIQNTVQKPPWLFVEVTRTMLTSRLAYMSSLLPTITCKAKENIINHRRCFIGYRLHEAQQTRHLYSISHGKQALYACRHFLLNLGKFKFKQPVCQTSVSSHPKSLFLQ